MTTTRARRPCLTRAAAWRHIAMLYETTLDETQPKYTLLCSVLSVWSSDGLMSVATLAAMVGDVERGIMEQHAATGSGSRYFEPVSGQEGKDLRATYALLMAHLAESEEGA